MVSKYRMKGDKQVGLYRLAIRPAVAGRLYRLSRRLGVDVSATWTERLGRIAWAAEISARTAARLGRVGRSTRKATVNRAASWETLKAEVETLCKKNPYKAKGA